MILDSSVQFYTVVSYIRHQDLMILETSLILDSLDSLDSLVSNMRHYCSE